MTDLGNYSILLVLALTGYAALAGIIGGLRNVDELVRSAERAVLAAWGLCGVAMATLWVLLFQSDFRVEYVWGHSNRDLSAFYKVTSLWSGQEGSLLLWTFVILCYAALLVVVYRRSSRALMPFVVAVLASSAFFFTLLNVFVANPFKEIALVLTDGTIADLPNAPLDGRGLNPLLQHPAMGIHPPILYGGYVGFIVPFAFCIAALITRRLDIGWIRTIRRWTLAAWTLQGAGIMLGARWAYVELGWGGYWAWDPVENASLMPWLIATAFLHSIQIQEKKGMLKVWNVVLVLTTYMLCIFGTFTTRSGIMSSVHSFASSSIGGWFVGYIVVMVVITTWLLVTRLEFLKSEHRYESMVSRESAFLFNNVVLVVACFGVFWGTMYPVLTEALWGEKVGIREPWFNRVEVPMALILLFLTGVGPLLAWRKTSTQTLKKNLGFPAAVGAAASLALAAAGIRHGYALLSFGLCTFVAMTVLTEFYRAGRARARSISSGFVEGLIDLVRRNKRRYGGYIVHFAFVVLVMGLTGKAFDTETKVPVAIGDSVSIRGYELVVKKIVEGDMTDPNFAASRIDVDLMRDGKLLTVLKPESRFYIASEQPTTEVSRWGSFREDVYTVFVRTGPDEPPQLQVFVKPLVRWVWIGGMLMALGTILTMFPDHRPPRSTSKSSARAAQQEVHV